MNTRNDTSESQISRPLSVGEQTSLSAATPFGLFEACSGNRYLVTEEYAEDRGDTYIPVAITLNHLHLPRFSWQRLSDEPLEFGIWRGPFRLRLMHSLPHDHDVSYDKPGLIGIAQQDANILCRAGRGRCRWMSLGAVGEKGFDLCNLHETDWLDFDRWAIEPITAEHPFAERTRSRTGNVVLDVDQNARTT